ncbi:MAG: response regulator [bacterium]|nr:response regulator [bacterium]
MESPLNVLIVEDVEDDALLTVLELERGGYTINYKRVETAEEMLQSLQDDEWELIVSDNSLPAFSGMEALNVYKETGLDIPFLLISGNIVDQDAVDAMIAGANDYITKDNLSRLIPAVGRELEEARIRKKQAEAEEEIRRLNEDLEQRVEERTIELQVVNQSLNDSLGTLKKAKDQLVQSEKMAALGQLVAGLAHEINTPIGVGVTAASLLEDRTKDVIKRIASGKLKRSDLETYIKVSADASQAILTNLERAAELIANFKQVAADQSSEQQRVFNVKEYFQEVLHSLSYKYKRTKRLITLDCPGDITIESYPGVYFQVLTNLVMNSLIHGFEGREDEGKIDLKITLAENQIILIQYSDNGKGMDGVSLKKIFDPFFTTKRGQGGTGLGMHIVYNLVTQTLGGEIEAASTEAEGILFTLKIPQEPPSLIKTPEK